MSQAVTSHDASAFMSDYDYRRGRHIKENVRLHRQIAALVTSHPDFGHIGTNPAIENIAFRLGFEPHDLAIVEICRGKRHFTIVCVPHRLWNRPFPMGRLIDLRHRAREAGHDAVLVPQSIVEKQPRLDNAELMARTANIDVDATSRMAVLAHLIEGGACCLSELAGLIEHPDPFGAILHLVTTGVVAIDLGQCITPYSMVDIASPQTGARH